MAVLTDPPLIKYRLGIERQKPLLCPEFGTSCFKASCTLGLCQERQIAIARLESEKSSWARMAKELRRDFKISKRDDDRKYGEKD